MTSNSKKIIKRLIVIVILLIVTLQLIDACLVGLMGIEFILGYVVGISVCNVCMNIIKEK